MTAFLAHFWGDFILQNQVMADRKKVSSNWAAIHVAFYSLPFLLLMVSPHPRIYLPWNPVALAVIAGTHFLIDRYSLAGYWVRFYGIGCQGRFTGPVDPAPPFIAGWLAIIVDNTFHVAINHLALTL